MSAAVTPRWTPSRIRAATAHPKPQGALARVYNYEAGRFDGDSTLPEREVLRHIADQADIVAETPSPDARISNPVVWLLVPMTRRQLDQLAMFETDEREPDADREAEADAEPDHEGEPSLGWTNNADQTLRHPPNDGDLELDNCDHEDGGDLERTYYEGNDGLHDRPRLVPVTHHADLGEWPKLP